VLWANQAEIKDVAAPVSIRNRSDSLMVIFLYNDLSPNILINRIMKANRDLLLLSKKASPDPKELELEVEQLHELLFTVESVSNFCIANEIIDLNRYKIIQKASRIEKIIKEKNLKPFQFISNKN